MEKEIIKITECPRDAMQGLKNFIPTNEKADYLNQLLLCDFDRLDFGSFVSPKAIPQLSDTAEVLGKLQLTSDSTPLLAIVANARGAENACEFDEISFLGYPFSVSETFQIRNTNATIEESLDRVEDIVNLANKNNKKVLIYLSMAFGNLYGDEWNSDIVTYWADKIYHMGIRHIALADTVGVSDEKRIHELFSTIIPALPDCEITAHLHAKPQDVKNKAKAAIKAGCRSFDSAINGIGGCPMAGDELTGNMDTIKLLETISELNCLTKLETSQFIDAVEAANKFFAKHNH